MAIRRALVKEKGANATSGLRGVERKVTRSTPIWEGSPAVALASGMHAKVIPAKT